MKILLKGIGLFFSLLQVQTIQVECCCFVLRLLSFFKDEAFPCKCAFCRGIIALFIAGGRLNVNKFALLLVIIGALNWGLFGLFQIDLIGTLFGGASTLASRIVYTLIGLAGIYAIRYLISERETETT